MAVKADRKVNIKKYLPLVIAVLLAAILFVLLYYLLIIPSLYGYLYREKETRTLEMVETGISVLDHFHRLERQGLISREEAQEEAANLIRSIRYGPDKLDYFWVNDYNYQLIVHPYRADLEGEDLQNLQDSEGLYIFREFVRIGGEEGAGHLKYTWQYYGDFSQIEEKLSYIAAFEPWGWIIGTGVYLEDLEATILQLRSFTSLLLLFFIALTALLCYLYFKTRITRQELIESEEKYRLIAENTADTVTILDLDLNFRYVSPSVVNLHGFTAEEAVDRKLENTMTPESLQRAMSAFEHEMALLAVGKLDVNKTISLELEEYRKDGTTIWVDNTLSYIKDKDDKPLGIISVSKDITERKRQQDQLRLEQWEKTLILENITELVTYLDTDMRIVWANQAVLQAHRAETSAIIGKRCYELWHGLSKPCRECPVELALKTKKICHSVISYEDGTSWKMIGSPVADEEGTIIGVLDTALDITDLKKAEDELIKNNEELEKRVRERTAELELLNKELTAFTYSVSHDLRAPLRIIGSFSEALLERYENSFDQDGLNHLERINRASLRMNELIEDLLKLSRVTTRELKRERVDLSSMVETHARHLKDTEPARDVEFSVEPDILAKGDAALLRIAIENLLDNAWKYTRNIKNGRISFGREEQAGKQIFYLKDNGIGFKMDYVGKIFEPFQRLHRADEYPGTGIGLSIVQRIIGRHGGDVWAESRPGKGTAFYFTLPQ